MRRVTGTVALWLAITLMGCSGPSEGPAGAPDRLPVVATTSVVADVVARVGGEEIALEALMGAGVDPHLYKASAGDVRRMSRARIVFYTGLHLEGRMSELLADMGSRGVDTVAVAECVPEEDLIRSEEYSGLHDPHVWFDVELWSRTPPCVAQALAAADPVHAELFRQRAAAYRGELEELHRWVGRRVESVPGERRILITAHDAFGYFGRAYGLEVRGLLGVSTASEAGTSDVQRLAELIARRGIPAIFVETSVSPRYVQALREAVRARGGRVEIGGSLYSDALGEPGTSAETYVGTVRSNVDTIVTALGGDPPERLGDGPR